MPTYGLRMTGEQIDRKKEEKAKSALAASTIPDQLSQLRKLRLKGRGCAGAGASGIAAIIYRRFEKSPRNNRVIADLGNKIAIESAAQNGGASPHSKALGAKFTRYFLNERM